MEVYEEQNKFSTLSYNAGHMQEQGILQYRLNTEIVLEQITNYLSGRKTIKSFNPDRNEYTEEIVQLHKPLMNDEGIGELSNTIRLRINHHVVQGNFNKEQYFDFLERSRKEISYQLVLNCYNWDIKDDKIEKLIDDIMAFIEPFMSRLIENKERESYMQQFQTKEIINSDRKPNLIDNFKGGFR